MAKYPSFLFYYQDFLVGTAFMTLEEIGAYIKLLCFQADKGSLKEDEILKKIPDPIWRAICCKFKKDADGFYNCRLRQEMEKRYKFVQSRKKNLHMGNHMGNHMGVAMATHMDNDNDNDNDKDKDKDKDISFRKPENLFFNQTKEVQDYFYAKYKEVFGKQYIAEFAKDGAILKGLLKIIPADNLKPLIDNYLNTPDEFAEKVGYTIGLFKKRINSLQINKRSGALSEKGLKNVQTLGDWIKKKETKENAGQN